MNEFIKKNICLITQTAILKKNVMLLVPIKWLYASEIQQHIKCRATEKCTFVQFNILLLIQKGFKCR
jgi:hypothetical protein